MEWTKGSESREFLLAFLGMTVCGFLLFRPILQTFFLSDDFSIISAVAERGFFWKAGGQERFLRPLVVLSFLVDHALWGLRPIGYHLTNLMFHIANSFFVFVLTKRLSSLVLNQPRVGLSFFAGLLFLVLPCHSESVTWIAGRTDVIAVAFGLAATWCLLSLQSGFSARTLLLFSLMFAAALLTKECAVVFPLIWALLGSAIWLIRRGKMNLRQVFLPHLVVVFLMIAYFVARRLIFGSLIGNYGGKIEGALDVTLQRIAIAGLRSVSPPLPTTSWIQQPLSHLVTIVGLIVVAAIGITVVRARQRRYAIGLILVALLGSFVAGTIPTLGFSISLFDTQAERYLYLPSVFVCIGSAIVLMAAVRRRVPQVAVAVCLVAAQAGAMWVVNTRWITASEMARQFVEQVSAFDPEDVGIINVPDNCKGVYVFRCGLWDAYTFVGRERPRHDPKIISHTMDEWAGTCDVAVRAGELTVTLPPGWRGLRLAKRKGFSGKKQGESVTFSDLPAWFPSRAVVVDYSPDAGRMTFRQIDVSAVNRTQE